jgi:hypothetical protein
VIEANPASILELPDGRIALLYQGVRVATCEREPESTWRTWCDEEVVAFGDVTAVRRSETASSGFAAAERSTRSFTARASAIGSAPGFLSRPRVSPSAAAK